MANCVFPGCGVQRIPKYAGIGLFRVTSRKGDFYEDWRQKVINVILKYRVLSKIDLMKRVMNGNVYICERHYLPNEIEYTKTGQKSLALLAIPSQNLSIKSHSDPPKPERRKIIRHVINEKEKYDICYKSINELIKKAEKLKLNGWQMDSENIQVVFKKHDSEHVNPFIELYVDESLEFTCQVFGWRIPDTHELYKVHKRNMRKTTISSVISTIESYKQCSGINEMKGHFRQHSVAKKFDPDQSDPLSATIFHRSKNCLVLVKDEICEECEKEYDLFLKEKSRKQLQSVEPAKANAPLIATNPLKVISALKDTRKKCKVLQNEVTSLQNEINRMQSEIDKNGIDVNKDFENDIDQIMNDNWDTASPFMKLFWSQQKERCKLKNNAKYHPMVIRFCLSLAAKSASAYDELRDSQILSLPSRRTLRDYRNAIKPKIGFNPEIVAELCKLSSNLKKDYQKFVVISFDEMKIKENLVYDKNTNELIGFVDIGDPDLNYCTFDNEQKLATHMFCYYVRGVACDLKFCLAYFASDTLDSSQIMVTVGILEITCNLKVIAAVSDGASANRKFYENHIGMCVTSSDVVFSSINIYAQDRYIYFFADAPHLIKTTRNALYHSGPGKQRLMMNDGKEMVWSHICNLVYSELSKDIKLDSSLTLDHINLNPYSKMNVRLAAQILSNKVGVILKTYFPERMHATADLCLNMNTFFDITNVRCQDEGHHKLNKNLEPFRSVDDSRFEWLVSSFLGYLNAWKKSILDVPDLSQDEKNRRFLPHQTYDGLKITTYSIIGATKYLLDQGMPFVMTNRFNQDCLEEHFGRHRSLGRRSTNPTMHQAGYQSNTLRMQRSVVPATGNTKGAYKQKRQFSWYEVDETPLKKRNTRN